MAISLGVGPVSRGVKAGLGFGVHAGTVGALDGRGIQSHCSFSFLVVTFLNVHQDDTVQDCKHPSV